jgi:hypothetical protein
MSLKGADGVEIVTLFNSTPRDVTLALELGGPFKLHPVQQNSADRSVRRAAFANGSFSIPARTTAVFVSGSFAPAQSQ